LFCSFLFVSSFDILARKLSGLRTRSRRSLPEALRTSGGEHIW
jgi:hypothetical protein